MVSPRPSRISRAAGDELEAYLARHNVQFDRMVYIGDGSNDYCPARRLRKLCCHTFYIRQPLLTLDTQTRPCPLQKLPRTSPADSQRRWFTMSGQILDRRLGGRRNLWHIVDVDDHVRESSSIVNLQRMRKRKSAHKSICVM